MSLFSFILTINEPHITLILYFSYPEFPLLRPRVLFTSTLGLPKDVVSGSSLPYQVDDSPVSLVMGHLLSQYLFILLPDQWPFTL